MPAVARLGDAGSHGGSITSAALKWRCGGAFIARIGDTYACPIHGPNPIVSGSSKYLCEGSPIARVGDQTGCGATITSGGHWDVD